jgi:hypothetical protein
MAKEEKMKHVLDIVRCDLSLAIDMIPTPDNDPVKRRLRHGIEMITNVLEDQERWQAIQERWAREEV